MANEEEKKSPTKWIVLGCSGCLVVFLVFFALMFGTLWIATSGPVKVIDAQLGALNEGDLQKAYGTCSQGFKNATSFEKFKAFVEANPKVFKSKSSSFTKRNISGNQGTVPTTSTGTLRVRYCACCDRRRFGTITWTFGMPLRKRSASA